MPSISCKRIDCWSTKAKSPPIGGLLGVSYLNNGLLSLYINLAGRHTVETQKVGTWELSVLSSDKTQEIVLTDKMSIKEAM